VTSLLALLRRNRNYRYTWMAQVVSEVGDYFNNIDVFALVMDKSSSGLIVCRRHAFPRPFRQTYQLSGNLCGGDLLY